MTKLLYFKHVLMGVVPEWAFFGGLHPVVIFLRRHPLERQLQDAALVNVTLKKLK